MRTRLWMLVLSIIGISILFTSCQTNDPEDKSIMLDIQNSRLSDSSSALVVTQNDTVSLIITSDNIVKLHLHGYDLEREIAPVSTEILKFKATATGSFPITIHAISNYTNEDVHDHEEQMHGDLFESPLLQPGDSFHYQVEPNSIEQTIHYHSHLHMKLEGSLIVSSHASTADKIDITISDKSADPLEVTVKPGTEITWIHKDTVPHIIVSGRHPETSMQTEHSKSEHLEEESEHDLHELELGRLEVHPR